MKNINQKMMDVKLIFCRKKEYNDDITLVLL
jgi:hypothetical protein